MSVIEMALLLVVAVACGALVQFLSGATRGGCPVSVGVAVIGAYAAPRIARWQGWAEPFTLRLGEFEFPVVWSLAGGLALAFVVNMLSRGRRF